MAVRPIDGTWSKFVWNLSESESLARKFRDGKACLIDLRLAVETQPTLTPPNEPLTVLVNDEPDREYIDYICPRCKNTISQRRRGQRMETVYKCKFHDNCGQRVDWSNPQPYRRPPEAKDNNVPTNDPLTIEQLREMDGEPVYVHNLFPAKRKFEWQWALVCKERGNAEATTYTYRFLDYGKTWIAYRRPPEGENA